MNYLTYVEYVPENLLFYLWFRDYVKRFSSITDSDKALSPDWRPMQTHLRQAPMAKDSPKEVDCETATLDENASLAEFRTGSEHGDKEPAQPNASSATLNSQRSNATWSETFLIGKNPKEGYKKLAADAFAADGITYQPGEIATSSTVMPLILDSRMSTVPRGDYSNHWHLHRQRRPSPAQPVRQGTWSSTPRLGLHHPSLGATRHLPDCRAELTASSPSEFYSVVDR